MKWRILLTLSVIAGALRLINYIHAKTIFTDERSKTITIVSKCNDMLTVKIESYPPPGSDETLNKNESTERNIDPVALGKNGQRFHSIKSGYIIKHIYWQGVTESDTYVIALSEDSQPQHGDTFIIYPNGQYTSDFTGTGKAKPYTGAIPDESTRSFGMSNPVIW